MQLVSHFVGTGLISYFSPICCNYWDKCINSHKIGQGCSTPLKRYKKFWSKNEIWNARALVKCPWSEYFKVKKLQPKWGRRPLWSVTCLTAHNWQKWKRVFLTCPCHKIYRDEAVGLKSCKNTWKITIFVKCEIWGNILKIWYFVNNCLIKARI